MSSPNPDDDHDDHDHDSDHDVDMDMDTGDPDADHTLNLPDDLAPLIRDLEEGMSRLLEPKHVVMM
jgi:hypothetical protein